MDSSIRLKRIFIKNFRWIGWEGVEINLDDIVVLVWRNNSWKSTVLKVLDKISKNNDFSLTDDDFFNKDKDSEMEIQFHTYIEKPEDFHVGTKEWVDSEWIVKEKFVPNIDKTKFERFWYRVDLWKWADSTTSPKAPFANDSTAANYRPLPTYISVFAHPDEQAKEISKLISTEINEKIREDARKQEWTERVLQEIRKIYEDMKKSADIESALISGEINPILQRIFKSSFITIWTDISDPDFIKDFWNTGNIQLKIGDIALAQQWWWIQRTLMWAILKMLSERPKISTKLKKTTKTYSIDEEKMPSRTRILLLDEPEICLHPDSIRQAKEVLYNLPNDGKWQVIITTHSPCFIDLTKDNTTIIRVDREHSIWTKLYRPADAGLSSDDKENLKMLNLCDPYVAEFFFSKNIIIVEGDTEYTALQELIREDIEKYKDIHIIRARWKWTIVPLIKILAKWQVKFSILHDSDQEKTTDGKKNSAWAANSAILDEVLKVRSSWWSIKLLASKKNFESTFFWAEVSKDKPFNALQKLKDPIIKQKVSLLLNYLVFDDPKNVCPSEVVEYSNVSELL
jgi:putative ATP-dependent endonuclease of OLD family